MAKSSVFYRFGANTAAVSAIGTSYAIGKMITIKMNSAVGIDNNPTRMKGLVESIRLNLSAATGVSTVTWKLCSDTAGDITVIQPTTSTLEVGLTTATKKSASGTINIPLQNENTDSFADTFYLFAKGDAGTFTLDTVEFGWSE
tara:strand:+ start:2734 stop:3165 length:432 start_codon:yes stop_codon:yes gene_type:complete